MEITNQNINTSPKDSMLSEIADRLQASDITGFLQTI
jgi:hypothetical protein